jgi:hypothetical protein
MTRRGFDQRRLRRFNAFWRAGIFARDRFSGREWPNEVLNKSRANERNLSYH